MTGAPNHVAIVGKDARTEAIASCCSMSPLGPRLTRVASSDADAAFAELAADPPDLVLVGPEAPLCAGIADRLEDDLGVRCFGPRKAHARVEGSKAWTRELVSRHGLAGNPEYRIFRHTAGLEAYLTELGGFVVKPDGLTGGKGVKVSGDHLASIAEGCEYASALIASDGVVVIEERLDGEEFSLQTITDGSSLRHCPLVQDHKRAFEGDTGPNTGGMGSYSMPDHSLPWLTDAEASEARAINEAVIAALGEEAGRPFVGVLYGGFMVTGAGVRLVEYNARLGDPEATNVLSILSSDLVEIAWAATNGDLGNVPVTFDPKATVCKYVVPEGYPAGAAAGTAINASALRPLEEAGDVRCYWAAVDVDGSEVRMSSSRALAVVGIGDSLAEAEARAEQAARLVRGPVRHRSDIGTEALLRRRAEHMTQLRR
jgi:phosphoribosylamine--glycine ligase